MVVVEIGQVVAEVGEVVAGADAEVAADVAVQAEQEAGAVAAIGDPSQRYSASAFQSVVMP